MTSGIGFAFHHELRAAVLEAREVDFLEVFAERYFPKPGAPPPNLNFGDYPIVLHCLGLSLGTAESLDQAYVRSLKHAVDRAKPAWISDHMAMTSVAGADIGHLAPVSLTDETVANAVHKIRALKDRLQLPFILENIAALFRHPDDAMKEWELYRRILEQADCGMLLDLNNLYANALNFGYDPMEFLRALPLERIVEVHLAGGLWRQGMFLDSHAHPVSDEVWSLLEFVCRNSAVRGVVLERDKNFEPVEQLVGELRRARAIFQRTR